MSTERFRRVAQLWNWLPAFRGVAEHESIHKASIVLGTSPSALSRTVKLLEDCLGVDLFVRRAQSLALTTDGTRLLAATRDAMRLVDDGLPADADRNRPALPVIVGVASPTAGSAVALALAAAAVRELGVRTAVANVEEEAGVEALLRGELDLVVGPSASPVAGVLVERAGQATIGVYATRTHPLAALERAPSEDDLAAAPFAARDGNDGWPVERTRNVVASSPTLDGVLALCAEAGAVTALCDLLVSRLVGESLARLCDAGPPQVLYVLRRKPLEHQDTRMLDAIVGALRSCLDP